MGVVSHDVQFSSQHVFRKSRHVMAAERSKKMIMRLQLDKLELSSRIVALEADLWWWQDWWDRQGMRATVEGSALITTEVSEKEAIPAEATAERQTTEDTVTQEVPVEQADNRHNVHEVHVVEEFSESLKCSAAEPDSTSAWIYAEPKLPMSAFFLFAQSRRGEISRLGVQAADAVNSEWDSLPAMVKDEWCAQESKLQEVSAAQLQEYREFGRYRASASEQDLDAPNSADIQGEGAGVANDCREKKLEFSSEQVKVMVDTTIYNIMQHPACADVPDGFFEDIAQDLKRTISSRIGHRYSESEAKRLMDLVVSKCADAMK